MEAQTVTELSNRITGGVITPDSSEYETRRRVLNRVGSPAVIVRAESVEDIVTALHFAREQRAPVSVRSGGHLLTGQATNDGGLVVDLARFNTVTLLDAEQHLVRIGAGAHWGEVATALAEHDLAISSGDTRQVGVGGLTLGGGVGWMVRTHGLTIDSLRAAELVTADGRVLRVSAEEYPDLFWAIRGGGGNFGVVASFDFAAQPCKGIVGGSVIYDTAEAHSVLTNWVSAMNDAPDELNSTLVLFLRLRPASATTGHGSPLLRRRQRDGGARRYRAVPAPRRRAITGHSEEALCRDARRRSASPSIIQDGGTQWVRADAGRRGPGGHGRQLRAGRRAYRADPPSWWGDGARQHSRPQHSPTARTRRSSSCRRLRQPTRRRSRSSRSGRWPGGHSRRGAAARMAIF